jgi:hypothetical protein
MISYYDFLRAPPPLSENIFYTAGPFELKFSEISDFSKKRFY